MTDVESIYETFTLKVLSGSRHELNYEEWSDERLMDTFKEALQTIKILVTENEIFERFLKRKDPGRISKLSQVVQAAKMAQVIAPLRQSQRTGSKTVSMTDSTGNTNSSTASLTSGTGSFALGSLGGRSIRKLKGFKILLDHRVEMAKQATARLQKKYSDFEHRILKEQEKLEIEYEEMMQRNAEIDDSSAVFKRDVLDKAHPETHKVPFESFMKFFDDQLKQSRKSSDRYNLKIVTTKRLIGETRKQLDQQNQMGGDKLRPIDFQKLEIETEHVIKETEVNHQTLKSLKKICAHYNLTFKQSMAQLIEKKLQLQGIENEVTSERQTKEKILRAQPAMTREVRAVQLQLNHLKELRDEYEYPEVADFLDVQRQLQEVEKNYKKRCRQRKIQLFTLMKPLRKRQ